MSCHDNSSFFYPLPLKKKAYKSPANTKEIIRNLIPSSVLSNFLTSIYVQYIAKIPNAANISNNIDDRVPPIPHANKKIIIKIHVFIFIPHMLQKTQKQVTRNIIYPFSIAPVLLILYHFIRH